MIVASSTAIVNARAVADDNLGPLETTFTPAAGCATLYTYADIGNDACTDCLVLQKGRRCYGGDVDYPDLAGCWPPQQQQQPSSSSMNPPYDLDGGGYYSPGIYCPSGYYTACSAFGTAAAAGGSFQFQFAPGTSETAIGCCPLSYSCANHFQLQTCQTVAQGVSVAVSTCSSGTVGPLNTYVPSSYEVLTTSGSSTGTEFAQTVMVLAPMIQLMQKDSDLNNLSANPSTISTSTAAAAASAATSSNPDMSGSSDSLPPSSGHHRLSKGAIAGIAIGVLVGALAMLGAVFYLFRTRRRRQPIKSGVELAGTAIAPASELAAGPVTVASPESGYVFNEKKVEEPIGVTIVQNEASGDGPYEMPAAATETSASHGFT